jgi:hypothetical protein
MPINFLEQRAIPSSVVEADEGKYFVAVNPTMGTGIAMGIQTTFNATANVLGILVNNAAAGSGKRLYVDYIRLICTAAGTTTTASDLAVVVDNTNRYSSGGTQLTPVCVNADLTSLNTSALAYFGALTAAAANAARVVSRLRLKTQAAPCWVVGDSVFVKFSAQDGQGIGPTSGTAAQNIGLSAGPVIIGAGESVLFHMWNTANATTPPSFEVEIGWYER